jgi:hypothetical protein
LALDEGNYQFRSCAWSFAYLGNTERAMDFVRPDAGSEWAAWATTHILVREGKLEEARESGNNVSCGPKYQRNLLQACFQQQRPANLYRIVHDAELSTLAQADPEDFYHAPILLFSLTRCSRT